MACGHQGSWARNADWLDPCWLTRKLELFTSLQALWLARLQTANETAHYLQNPISPSRTEESHGVRVVQCNSQSG